MKNQDSDYKKALLPSLGLGLEDYKKLSPIIDSKELQEIVTSLERCCYEPGQLDCNGSLDSYDYCYLKSGIFRANLHVHSNNSDGMVSVKRLLNHAAKIGDKLFEKNGSKFLLAITDHDTLEGAKELLRVVAANPHKYRNLKIVPGVEISTIAKNFENQIKPISIHTLVYCINPFDEKLNDFISQKARLKLDLSNDILEILNTELEPELKKLGIKFSLSEAEKIHEMVGKGQDAVCPPMRKYTAAKILFEYFVKELGLDSTRLSLERPLRKYKKLFRGGFEYCEAYRIAFGKYVSDIYKREFDMPEIPENIKKIADRARELCLFANPKMQNLQPAFADFDETVKFISSLPYGDMCVAHPGRIFSENINCEMKSFYRNLFEKFKITGGERAKYFEEFYCSYEGEKTFCKLDCINETAKKSGLLSTGGLDSHGPNIISRWPYF